MGAWGGLIMGFFGSLFASMTMYWQWHRTGAALALPFMVFGVLLLAACHVLRLPGQGIRPSPAEERAILWSSIGEGIGLFVVSNLVINLHRPDLLMPTMALVVGLHFLPIAFAAGFRPFHVLGAALLIAGVAGIAIGAPLGGALAGLAAAAALWLAAVLAVRRDWRAKVRDMADA